MSQIPETNVIHVNQKPKLTPQELEYLEVIITDKVRTKLGTRPIYRALQFLVALASLVLMGFLLYQFIKSTNPSTPFESEDVDQFSKIVSMGKEDLIQEVLDEMYRITDWIQTENHDDLRMVLDETNFSYLLYGPPGTGKSIFAKEIAYRYDLSLKERWLRLKDNNRYQKIKDMPEINDYLKTEIKSRLNYMTVYPSMILEKYVGESAKNVKRLFTALKTFKDKDASIALFDEGDALFYSRDGQIIQTSDNSMSVQSEFLSNLSQQTKKYAPVFVFVTTNFIERIDPAFARRLGKKLKFDLPTPEERKQLIEQLFTNMNIKFTQKNVNDLVIATKDASHSFITKTIKDHIVFDGKKPKDFNHQKCIAHCFTEENKI